MDQAREFRMKKRISVKSDQENPHNSTEAPKKRGRKPTGRMRQSQFLLRLTAEEREQIDAAALRSGTTVTAWAVAVLLRAAKHSQ